ncbi:uncharacterized protein At4g14100-like [Lotus japonicus]|uniref:uncharacterized protein At4g14100-like n=1 Tax=Lotus japonicus TaxID=34305 RepID=UPI00258E54D4|nr:uncharacterized protein At4g14100-like [Lotus japonicus]
MASSAIAATKRTFSVFTFLILLLSSSNSLTPATPVPADWPEQFHSVMFMNRSDSLQKLDLWYDWPNGRNFNIIQDQLNPVVTYDLEWTNGTSFVYTLHPSDQSCEVLDVPVGILRPNWLDGATYLGQETVDNFLCNVWEKVEFITYYEDVLTRRPVKWVFYSGYTAHVMTFEVGAVLEDPNWQAPVYCFNGSEKERSLSLLGPAVHGDSFGRLMRGVVSTAEAL